MHQRKLSATNKATSGASALALAMAFLSLTARELMGDLEPIRPEYRDRDARRPPPVDPSAVGPRLENHACENPPAPVSACRTCARGSRLPTRGLRACRLAQTLPAAIP